jgi:predicted ribonuclease YlaK
MKKIYWNLLGKEVMFNVNWFEYWILKRIFKKKKYEVLKSQQIRGQKIDVVIVDEASNLDFTQLSKKVVFPTEKAINKD